MKKEFDTRPTFDVMQQLQAMDRAKGASTMDGWFGSIGEFMRTSGAIPSVPAPADYISDVYMKRVRDDPKLREFATRTN